MSALRSFAALLAALVLVPSLAAQVSEKQAVAQLKAASKAQLKAFKQAGADAMSALNDGLATLEGQLTDSSAPQPVAIAANTAAVGFVAAMNTAWFDAVNGVDTAGATALQALAGGGSLDGEYPPDFCYGTGGALDDFRAALTKSAEKLRDAALKRLAKTAAKATKVSNLAMEVELRFPTMEVSQLVDQGGVQAMAGGSRLDLVLAVSSLAATSDGVIEISGSSADLADNLDVGCLSQDGIVATGAFTPPGDRFGVEFDVQPEHAYIAFVKQGGFLYSTISIGLR